MQELPQNNEAEQNVIGSIIKNNNCLVDIIGVLTPEDFYKASHKIIYRNITEMFRDDIPIDVTTLVNKLGKNNLKSVGGITYITQVEDSIATTRNVKQYAKIVKEKADRRRIIKACISAYNTAYNEENTPSNVISQLENNLLNIDSYNANTIMTEADVMTSTLDSIESNYKRGGEITGMTTGYKLLDKTINGANKGDFIVIAARPSMGKTVFALNVGENMAKKNRVLNFTLEMSNKKLMLRKLAKETLINSSKLRMGNLNDTEWETLSRKSDLMVGKSKMLYDDTAGITVQQVKARCKKAKLKYGLDAIIIDHLGLLDSGLKTEDPKLQLKEITRQCKKIAKELDICVIGLSQLNRGPDMRSEHRPVLADLRDSGTIEQDADIVIGLYRDEYYDPETADKNIMETILLKNRDGQLGTIKLTYIAEYQMITEIPRVRQ